MSSSRVIRFHWYDMRHFLTIQIKTLMDKGYHEALGVSASEFWSLIMETAGKQIPVELEVLEHELPVMIVIPNLVLSRQTQCRLLGIESDDFGLIRDSEECPISNPYLRFRAEYDLPENKVPAQYTADPRGRNPLSFDQGLSILAQCEELRSYCQGLCFAGSYSFDRGIKLVPVFTSNGSEMRIRSFYYEGTICAMSAFSLPVAA